MIARTKPLSWQGCERPTDNQRVIAFREQLMSRGDYQPEIHAAQIRFGVTWIEEFRRRPIPRHRALVVIEKP